MKVIANLPAKERLLLFTEAERRMGIKAFHMEKDFWVCWVLEVLFRDPEVGPHLTFRGGTSLSKAWGVIERFSEDIDLAMSRSWLGAAKDPGETGISSSEKERRRKNLRDECREMIAERLLPVLEKASAVLPEPGRIELEPLEKARDPFCLHFHYPGTDLEKATEYNLPQVKIELSGRADDWPMEERTIRPYVAELFPKETGDPRLVLSCVKPERTFWEKAALIHEQNIRPEARPLAARQARHLSDLVRLWNAGVSEVEGFHELFARVKAHRRAYFDYNWVDYEALSPGDLRLVPPVEKGEVWRGDYEAMREMFFSEPPGFDEVLSQLTLIESALGTLHSNSTRTLPD